MLYKKLFLILAAFTCFSSNTSDVKKPSKFKAAMLAVGVGIVSPALICAGVIYAFDVKIDGADILKKISASFLGTASFVAPTALIYAIGKRGYIPYLTNYLKKGECRPNFAFIGMQEGKRFKVKIGADLYVWGVSMFASLGVFKLFPMFAKNSNEWITGTMVLGQWAVNFWAQQLPARYNPFVWTNAQGKNESVLIFPSKWGRSLRYSDREVRKTLLSNNL